MHVLVFEPKYVGHFLGFATYAANAFARRGCRVTMVVPQGAEGSDQARVKLSQRLPGVEVAYVLDVPVKYDKWANAAFESEALDACLADFPADEFVAPSADFLICGLAQRRPLRKRLQSFDRCQLILHNCAQAYPGLGKRERLDLLRDQWAVDRCRRLGLLCVDPFALSPQAVRRLGLWGQPVAPLPHPYDPISERPTRSAARVALGIPTEPWLIGSIGDLGVRKGTELLIHSFARYAHEQPGHLALFGILSKSARQALEEYPHLHDRIHLRNAFVSEEEFVQFLAAVHVVWAGYPRHFGIASVLLHAADADRPVLASPFGCVGWMTREYGLGACIPTDPVGVAEIMARVSAPTDTSPFPDSRRAALIHDHNTSSFERVLAEHVRSPEGVAVA